MEYCTFQKKIRLIIHCNYLMLFSFLFWYRKFRAIKLSKKFETNGISWQSTCLISTVNIYFCHGSISVSNSMCFRHILLLLQNSSLNVRLNFVNFSNFGLRLNLNSIWDENPCLKAALNFIIFRISIWDIIFVSNFVSDSLNYKTTLFWCQNKNPTHSFSPISPLMCLHFPLPPR